MNILHHKSWHVYNKANIEKVRQDEAKAEEEAKKKHDRVVLAESEARLELLRQRANVNLPVETKPSSVVQHVNLFQDLEDKATNEEYEAEKKTKQDKQEKQFTMYLDKGTSQQDRPWYARSDKKEDKYKDQYVFKSNRDDSKKRKREAIKVMEDPLEYITKSLKKKKHKKESKHHRHKEKEHKSSIEELRAKRLEREKAEQARAKSLFLGHNPIEEEMDDRTRAYNSQFNRIETLQAKQKHKK
ncbi:uncharacterized protein B0P05DRAFT_524149 [Gilbertella persicaria]|uniref:Leukocyte receptor cluster member 1 n=1 Tax=Rhizopus stolonifer TaxID=4846 RepID=A0A367K266_RHIST|nr:uncharacterized protein B0P05DRAFT_524149 [Gilbertella persicaria]KAI8094974.1 hypothetical protein B0P05DRAFT_524149 [Gilbertella persicaria]RCH95981.1 Leukocyte receptor cluster member 1 [Rhizopus stolonifer]